MARQLDELGTEAVASGMFTEPSGPVEVSEDGRTTLIPVKRTRLPFFSFGGGALVG